jgi:nucleotidyltransferase substrate binding protein (TIGR01987 family)
VAQEFKTDLLRRAIAQLEEAVSLASEELRLPDSRYRLHLRAGAIQAFEYTYELCEKMLRRSLRLSESGEEPVGELTFSELFRLGYRRGLVKGELRKWLDFRGSRNRTSHTYREEDAQAVFEAIPEFLEEARFLLDALDRTSRRARESGDA